MVTLALRSDTFTTIWCHFNTQLGKTIPKKIDAHSKKVRGNLTRSFALY